MGIVWERIQTMATSLLANLPNFIIALAVFVLAYIAASRSGRTVKNLFLRNGRSANAATVFALITRWGIILMGLLIGLSIALPSFAPEDLIQILGISSVAIGFAFRDIFENFLAGLIILLTDAFQIGDQIIVEDVEGTVINIETRATTIQTYDDRKVIMPNAKLLTNAVVVNTASQKLRSEEVVGISYNDDINTAQKVILETLKQIDGVLAKPAPDVLVVALADSSVNLRARWWTDATRSQVVRVKSEVVRQIKYALDENGITIPFPIRDLYLKGSLQTVPKEAGDGTRA